MRKEYTGRSLKKILEEASVDFNCDIKDLKYKIIDEKKGFIFKKIKISVYSTKMLCQYLELYLISVLTNMGFEDLEISIHLKNKTVYICIESNNNSLLIGKNGKVLDAIQNIIEKVIQNNFKCHYDVYVDVNNYKKNKQKKLIYTVKNVARNVVETRIDAQLDPLPSDERKLVHQIVRKIDGVHTKSVGEGDNRRVCIIYDKNKFKSK